MSQDLNLGLLYEKLGTIDGKLDMLLALDLDVRISRLERWRSKLIGMGVVVTALFTGAFHYFAGTR